MMKVAGLSAVVLVLSACSGVEEATKGSTPVEASQQIGQQSVGELDAGDASSPGPLFVRGRPLLPAPLRMISFGMDAASARAAVELARHPEVPLFDSTEGDVVLLGGQLPDIEGVGFTVIIRGGIVAEIDVSIPAEGALERLTDLWGPGQPEDSDGLSAVVWAGSDHLQARLFQLEDDKSVVKFSKQAK